MSDEPIDWSERLRPCGDGSCIFGPPEGMRTNGGCQHLKLDLAETRRLLRRALAGHDCARGCEGLLAARDRRIAAWLRARATSEQNEANLWAQGEGMWGPHRSQSLQRAADVLREMADEIERGEP